MSERFKGSAALLWIEVILHENIPRLKQHALTLGVLHLLTYADDSATGFFEKAGFDPEPAHGMHLNRFHWGISHYIGSQLRQCVLDPDGATLYSADFGRKVPEKGRRLAHPHHASATDVAAAPSGEAAAEASGP